ncbi:MAG: hypothetical protein J6T08_07180, partial [Lentisphaeria bacterium]|nr:hypothetical protein [Lentisphaeria bacterium]
IREGNASFIIRDSQFINNTTANPGYGSGVTYAQSNGGALYIVDRTDSFTASYGGVSYKLVYENSTVDVQIENTLFQGGRVNGYGGAIFIGGTTGTPGSITITGSTFIDNEASLSGGAIYQGTSGQGNQGRSTTPVIKVIDTKFIGNTSGLKGGGALFMTNFLNVDGSYFEGNKAADGGGLFLAVDQDQDTTPKMNVVVENTAFNANYAENSGGGMVASTYNETTHTAQRDGWGTNVRMENLTFVNNEAGTSGGGLTVTRSSINQGGVWLINSTLVGNSVDSPNGFYVKNYDGNESAAYFGGGGGIYVGVAGSSPTRDAKDNGWNLSKTTAKYGAYLFMLNNLVVDNTSRESGGIRVADDVTAAEHYAGGVRANSTAGITAGLIGTVTGSYNVVGKLTGFFYGEGKRITDTGVLSVNNVYNNSLITAENLFDLNKVYVNGMYVLDARNLLQIRELNLGVDLDAQLDSILNHENLSIASYQSNGGLYSYAFRDTTYGDTNWYGLRQNTGSTSDSATTWPEQIVQEIVAEETIDVGYEVKLDGGGIKRTPAYTAGSAQNTSLFAWTELADGSVDRYYTVSEVREGLANGYLDMNDNDAYDHGTDILFYNMTLNLIDTTFVLEEGFTVSGKVFALDLNGDGKPDYNALGSFNVTLVGSADTCLTVEGDMDDVFHVTDAAYITMKNMQIAGTVYVDQIATLVMDSVLFHNVKATPKGSDRKAEAVLDVRGQGNATVINSTFYGNEMEYNVKLAGEYQQEGFSVERNAAVNLVNTTLVSMETNVYTGERVTSETGMLFHVSGDLNVLNSVVLVKVKV